MDSTTENDYFELEPFDQYKQHEVSQNWFIFFIYLFINRFIWEIVEFDSNFINIFLFIYALNQNEINVLYNPN